jgi:hypothetical protein
MTIREHLDEVLASLPEHRVVQVADFAQYLGWLENGKTENARDWGTFGLGQLAKCYGPDEPEYTDADLKPEPRR